MSTAVIHSSAYLDFSEYGKQPHNFPQQTSMKTPLKNNYSFTNNSRMGTGLVDKKAVGSQWNPTSNMPSNGLRRTYSSSGVLTSSSSIISPPATIAPSVATTNTATATNNNLLGSNHNLQQHLSTNFQNTFNNKMTSQSSFLNDVAASLLLNKQVSVNQQLHHRKLDRSMSEPVVERSVGLSTAALIQQQQQINNNSSSGGGNSSRYKTELCRPYEENGSCKYGDKCQFAHGPIEIRNLTRHPKYKTEKCRPFHNTGICPYGPRCHFKHNEDEHPTSGKATGEYRISGPDDGLGSTGNSPPGSPPDSGCLMEEFYFRSACNSTPATPTVNNQSSLFFGDNYTSSLKYHINNIALAQQQDEVNRRNMSRQLSLGNFPVGSVDHFNSSQHYLPQLNIDSLDSGFPDAVCSPVVVSPILATPAAVVTVPAPPPLVDVAPEVVPMVKPVLSTGSVSDHVVDTSAGERSSVSPPRLRIFAQLPVAGVL